MTATINISDLDSSLEGNWLEVICPDFRYVRRLHPKIFQLGWIFAVDQMVVVHKQIIPPNRFPTICYVMVSVEGETTESYQLNKKDISEILAGNCSNI
jgi:hypothetical protein